MPLTHRVDAGDDDNQGAHCLGMRRRLVPKYGHGRTRRVEHSRVHRAHPTRAPLWPTALTHAAERAVRLLLWGRESVVVGTCMQGERALRVVVGTPGATVLSGGREPSDTQSDRIRHALRRPQMHSDAMIRRTWSDGVVGWASNASVRASMAVPDDGGNQRYSVVINGAQWQSAAIIRALR